MKYKTVNVKLPYIELNHFNQNKQLNSKYLVYIYANLQIFYVSIYETCGDGYYMFIEKNLKSSNLQ